MSMFAAIDWGGQRHQLAVVDHAGREVLNECFDYDAAGLAALLDALGGFELSGVAIERSEGLLVEHLQTAGHTVFAVSPRVSARARERHQAAARKSDRFDAFVLADALRTDGWRWRPLAVPSPTLAELRALVRHRHQASRVQVRAEEQLRATLEAFHPAIVDVFSSVDRTATLQLLRAYPTPQNAARVTPDRMARFARRIGYSGRTDPAVLHDRLQHRLVSAAPGSVAGHSVAALALADQVDLLNAQLKAYDQRIATVFESHPDAEIFASFPATGPVLGPALLADIGEDRDRFPTHQVLLAEAGLAPVTLASGKVHRVRIRYACNKRLRSTCDSWAYVLKRIDEPTRHRYIAGLERGHTKHRALRGVAATWLRRLWRAWQDHVPYDPARRLDLTG